MAVVCGVIAASFWQIEIQIFSFDIHKNSFNFVPPSEWIVAKKQKGVVITSPVIFKA
jgi:hypothetical protein